MESVYIVFPVFRELIDWICVQIVREEVRGEGCLEEVRGEGCLRVRECMCPLYRRVNTQPKSCVKIALLTAFPTVRLLEDSSEARRSAAAVESGMQRSYARLR